MKKIICFLFALAAVSCGYEDCGICPDETSSEAQVTVEVSAGGESTKAPYVSAEAYESRINSLQVFIFDMKGRLNAYKSSLATNKLSITTTYGDKTVWAVVNGPDLRHVRTVEALTSAMLDLSANSTDEDRGFVMAGSAESKVDKADVTAYVNVSRLTSRIAICSITNRLPEAYPDMTIESVMLANVAGNQNISGTAPIDTWYNKAGRQDGGDSGSIIDGVAYTASCPELTFRKLEETIPNGEKLEKTCCLYSYPNDTVTDASGWTSPFTGRKTRLVVTARIAGERFYYPVVLESLERNKAYTVNMTITSLGSNDPDKKVEKGTVTATVSVLPWHPGSEYTETI